MADQTRRGKRNSQRLGANRPPDKSGTARREKNRRSRVAALKLRAGSAASRTSLSDGVTVAILSGAAT